MSETCRICGNSRDNVIHTAREMMFGTRDEFRYIECRVCGTVQIAEIPDLAKYYPLDYYSLNAEPVVEIAKTLKRRVASRLMAGYLLTGRGNAGKSIASRWPEGASHFPKWIADAPFKTGLGDRILDYGCGTGQLLQTMHTFGFRRLTGADAFIDSDISYPSGIRIYRRSLAELSPAFDIIMLHHSFEHLPEPREALREIRRLLDKDGHLVIRIPVVNDAWRTYGVNWVQLDPPRHLFLYTETGFRELAESEGFAVRRVVYDSTGFQFYGSEEYLGDIAMNDARSFKGDIDKSIFDAEQIRKWEKDAEKLNAEGRGDQACFYLQKA